MKSRYLLINPYSFKTQQKDQHSPPFHLTSLLLHYHRPLPITPLQGRLGWQKFTLKLSSYWQSPIRTCLYSDAFKQFKRGMLPQLTVAILTFLLQLWLNYNVDEEKLLSTALQILEYSFISQSNSVSDIICPCTSYTQVGRNDTLIFKQLGGVCLFVFNITPYLLI